MKNKLFKIYLRKSYTHWQVEVKRPTFDLSPKVVVNKEENSILLAVSENLSAMSVRVLPG